MICIERLLNNRKDILGMDRNVTFFKYSHICNCNISRELLLLTILSDRFRLNVLGYPTLTDADYPTSWALAAIVYFNVKAIVSLILLVFNRSLL